MAVAEFTRKGLPNLKRGWPSHFCRNRNFLSQPEHFQATIKDRILAYIIVLGLPGLLQVR